MAVFKPNDMDRRFADATMHGFLEKMTLGWRSFFSSSAKVQWVKQYYVLRNDTIYVYQKDSYEKPIDTISLEPFSIKRGEPARSAKYGGKEWVLELNRPDESPLVFAAENKDLFKCWSDKLFEAIEESNFEK